MVKDSIRIDWSNLIAVDPEGNRHRSDDYFDQTHSIEQISYMMRSRVTGALNQSIISDQSRLSL